MSSRVSHIPVERLADLAEGRPASSDRETSLVHLNECSQCTRQLARLSEVLSLMRTDTAENAPRDVIASVIDSFRAREKRAPLARRILAALNFDSTILSPAFGVRSGIAPARQLLYTAGENDLDLRITPGNESWVVSGQVLGECAGGHVQLEEEDAGGKGAAATAELNGLCEFTLPPVREGNYTLRVRLAEAEIEVFGLELKA